MSYSDYEREVEKTRNKPGSFEKVITIIIFLFGGWMISQNFDYVVGITLCFIAAICHRLWYANNRAVVAVALSVSLLFFSAYVPEGFYVYTNGIATRSTGELYLPLTHGKPLKPLPIVWGVKNALPEGWSVRIHFTVPPILTQAQVQDILLRASDGIDIPIGLLKDRENPRESLQKWLESYFPFLKFEVRVWYEYP